MRLFPVALLVCSATLALADPLNRDSPQSAVTAFLQACHSQDYRRASRYLDLRKLPSNQRSSRGVQLAEQLGQILDRDTRFDEAALSNNPHAAPRQTVASFNVDKKNVELQLDRVNLRPGCIGMAIRIGQRRTDSANREGRQRFTGAEIPAGPPGQL